MSPPQSPTAAESPRLPRGTSDPGPVFQCPACGLHCALSRNPRDIQFHLSACQSITHLWKDNRADGGRWTLLQRFSGRMHRTRHHTDVVQRALEQHGRDLTTHLLLETITAIPTLPAQLDLIERLSPTIQGLIEVGFTDLLLHTGLLVDSTERVVHVWSHVLHQRLGDITDDLQIATCVVGSTIEYLLRVWHTIRRIRRLCLRPILPPTSGAAVAAELSVFLSHNELFGLHTLSLPFFRLTNRTINRLLTRHVTTLLHTLVLSDNALEELGAPFSHLPLLRILNVARNQIREWTPEAVLGMPLLASVNLQSNFLETIPIGALIKLTGLEVLDLRNNKLTEAPRDLMQAPRLTTLWLSNNNPSMVTLWHDYNRSATLCVIR